MNQSIKKRGQALKVTATVWGLIPTYVQRQCAEILLICCTYDEISFKQESLPTWYKKLPIFCTKNIGGNHLLERIKHSKVNDKAIVTGGKTLYFSIPCIATICNNIK